MERIDPAAWTDDDRRLWARIAAHDFEAAEASLTFAGRLARDHGWGLPQARVAVDEYRRFCFLALRAGREVTPSEEVDEVWHQHLTYSRDYWQVWCRAVLRRDLHHGPTRGGEAEGRRFAGQYADTLAAYEAWFGPPPAALWPGTAERFGRPRFHMVDRATHVAVPVPRVLLSGARRLARSLGVGALLTLVLARPAEAAVLNPLDWTAAPFLALYVTLACASLAAAQKVCALLQDGEPCQGGRSHVEPAELGLMAGGTRRAADVLILETIAATRILLEARESSFGPFSRRTVVLSTHGEVMDRAWLLSQKAEQVADLGHRLVEDGLLLSDARRRMIHRAGAAVVSPVLVLGLVKLAVGAERDKPVGLLFLLLIVTAFTALVLVASRSHTSSAGRDLVERYKSEHARALRAPRHEETIAAFAVVGAAALAGTAFEAYGQLLKAENGGGCGGCGGGGCGGCGGGD